MKRPPRGRTEQHDADTTEREQREHERTPVVVLREDPGAIGTMRMVRASRSARRSRRCRASPGEEDRRLVLQRKRFRTMVATVSLHTASAPNSLALTARVRVGNTAVVMS